MTTNETIPARLAYLDLKDAIAEGGPAAAREAIDTESRILAKLAHQAPTTMTGEVWGAVIHRAAVDGRLTDTEAAAMLMAINYELEQVSAAGNAPEVAA